MRAVRQRLRGRRARRLTRAEAGNQRELSACPSTLPTQGQRAAAAGDAGQILAPDRDSEVLAELVDGDPAADVVLSPAGEAAYQRYASRANGMWSLSDPLARYLY